MRGVSFADRLQAAVERTATPCIVGLDPHPELLPDEFAAAREPERSRRERARALADFCCAVIELVAGRVPAVKPQTAFFEALGADGVAAWERVVAAARAAGLLVLGDVKRGDIAASARAYADAYLTGPARCDAITVNAFLGHDSLAPFLEACRREDAGVFCLVRTSNPGSADFQRHGEPELSFVIADAVARWGAELLGECGLSSVGAVVGATHGAELARFRARMPRTPLLLPGYGAQGAGAASVVDAFLPRTRHAAPRGALVTSSRAILFAHAEPRYARLPWRDASRAALDEMIAAVGAALAGV
jgi:orotidine-5'-phosphate decarboxylase